MASKRRKQEPANPLSGVLLKPIRPKTEVQDSTFAAYNQNANLYLHGCAGTGKTFIALFLAIKDLMQNITRKIYIIRSTVPSRDLGFLPGEPEEKYEPYEDPYVAMCAELLGRSDAYDLLKKLHLLEFKPTSFLRGTTLNDCVVIVDEGQNMTFQELDTIITRVGKNCRIVVCADTAQTDLTTQKDRSGLNKFAAILKAMESFVCLEFGVADIVRSGLVKEYLLAKMSLASSS